MIVGFVITSFNGREDAAVEFISNVCILDNPKMAQNIVDLGAGVNVFSKAVTEELLSSQPFSCTPIEVEDGKCLVVSSVEFNIEVLYKGETLRLRPTEYIKIPLKDTRYFSEYERQGLVKVVPEIDDVTKDWVLNQNVWDDSGSWMDSLDWKDNE